MKLILILLSSFLFGISASAAEQRPNIVIILAADLGYGDLGCYSATKVKSPHIDRLAKEGMRFTQARPSAAGTTKSPSATSPSSSAGRSIL